jgi:hypothetical protein
MGRRDSDFKNNLYEILNTYALLTPIFRQHNIHLVSSACQHKYKWILYTEKPVLNASFQDFYINNHLFCFEKKRWENTHLWLWKERLTHLKIFLANFSLARYPSAVKL